MEHVVVSLAEEKSGARIGDADVTIEVKNPKGGVQKKPALPMVRPGSPTTARCSTSGGRAATSCA